MKNIYIIGEVCGAYRTKNFINYVLNEDDLKLYYYTFASSKNTIKKMLQAILKACVNILALLIADIVYIAPMCHNKKRYIKLAKLLNKKIVTEYYISFYDSNINDRKKFQQNFKKQKSYMDIDRTALTYSNKVIFLNNTEAKRYCSIADIKLDQINYEIIPLCIDEKRKAKLKYFNKEKNEIILCWWGTYIPLHGLDKIIKSIKLINNNGLKCKLYIFGDSKERALQYIKIAEENKVNEYVIFNNEFTFKNGKLEEFLVENCDIALGVFGDSEKAKTVITNKVIDGIALKCPVITGYSEGLNEYFDGKTDIYMINNTEIDIANKVIEISMKTSSEIFKSINKAYKVYKNHFSVESFNEKMSNLIKNL